MVAAGTRLGPYEITSHIGSGGMGDVYRARDTRLKRDVALKILPASFAADPARLARFRREAEALAVLDHPHIAGIYGLEEDAGITALALQLVEGGTLADAIEPRWSRDGRRLFYVALTSGLHSIDVEDAPVWRTKPPRLWTPQMPPAAYNLHPDGVRILSAQPPGGGGPPAPFTLVLNWMRRLEQ